MNILLQHYLSERLQTHFDALQLSQTGRLLEHGALVEALWVKGAIQEEEAPEYAITFEGFCLLSMRLTSPIAAKVHLGIIETVSAKK